MFNIGPKTSILELKSQISTKFTFYLSLAKNTIEIAAVWVTQGVLGAWECEIPRSFDSRGGNRSELECGWKRRCQSDA